MADEHSVAKLAGAACEAAGGVGAFFSREGFREWYPKIKALVHSAGTYGSCSERNSVLSDF